MAESLIVDRSIALAPLLFPPVTVPSGTRANIAPSPLGDNTISPLVDVVLANNRATLTVLLGDVVSKEVVNPVKSFGELLGIPYPQNTISGTTSSVSGSCGTKAKSNTSAKV